MKTIFFLLCLTMLSAQLARSQTNEAPNPERASSDGQVIPLNHVPAAAEPWFLNTRDGIRYIINRNNLSIHDDSVAIAGELRTFYLPKKQIKSITIPESRTNFRDAFIPTLLLASMLTLSPDRATGSYIGSQKIIEYSYNDYSFANPSEYFSTPGISINSFLYSLGSAVVVGLFSHLLRTESETIWFSGDETPGQWERTIATKHSRLKFHGACSYVFSSASSDWKDANSRYGIVDQPEQRVQSYYTTELRPDITRFNLSRLVRIGYEIDETMEAGVAVQFDGIQRLYQNFRYVRPSTPPTIINRQLSEDCRTALVLATIQYQVFHYEPLSTRIAIGAGVGPSFITANGYGFDYQSAQRDLANRNGIGMMLFSSIEYRIDDKLSAGLTLDYTQAGSLTIDAQNISDSDNRVILMIDPVEIPLRSFALGFSFTTRL